MNMLNPHLIPMRPGPGPSPAMMPVPPARAVLGSFDHRHHDMVNQLNQRPRPGHGAVARIGATGGLSG
eukprot:1978221-Rhodomonas_salina.1